MRLRRCEQDAVFGSRTEAERARETRMEDFAETVAQTREGANFNFHFTRGTEA